LSEKNSSPFISSLACIVWAFLLGKIMTIFYLLFIGVYYDKLV